MRVRFEGGTELVCTPGHRVYVVGQGWKHASEIALGDACLSADGKRVAFEGRDAIAEPVGVFNLEVEGKHTYFVGELKLAVHNDCWEVVGRGEENGMTGTYYQRVYYQRTWRTFWLRREVYGDISYGPRTFQPDIIYGIPSTNSLGTKELQYNYEHISNGFALSEDIGQKAVIVGGFFLPGPTDAIWGDVARNLGVRLVKKGEKYFLEKIIPPTSPM